MIFNLSYEWVILDNKAKNDFIVKLEKLPRSAELYVWILSKRKWFFYLLLKVLIIFMFSLLRDSSILIRTVIEIRCNMYLWVNSRATRVMLLWLVCWQLQSFPARSPAKLCTLISVHPTKSIYKFPVMMVLFDELWWPHCDKGVLTQTLPHRDMLKICLAITYRIFLAIRRLNLLHKCATYLTISA